MNRRSLLKALVGACAAMLFPWKSKHSRASVWSRPVYFFLGPYKYPGHGDQTERIELLLERPCRAGRQRLGSTSVADSDMYELGIVRHYERPETHIVIERGDESCCMTAITDAVALTMDDGSLPDQIIQGLLLAIRKDTTVWITSRDTFEDYKKNGLTI